MGADLLHLADALPAAVAVVLGVLLLVAGRRLAWMAVGVAGFLAAFSLFAPPPRPLEFTIAVLVGLFGALLAVVVLRLAVALAGFLVGGWLGAAVAGALGFGAAGGAEWLPFLVGGLAGALLASGVVDLALAAASALVGAALVMGVVADQGGLSPEIALLGWLALAATGLGVQLLGRRDRLPQRQERASTGVQRRPTSPT